MKYFILLALLFAPFAHAADWCDIQDKATGAVQQTYEGLCNQKRFGGPWGDPAVTVHVANTTKQKQIDDDKAAEDARKTKAAQRLTKIKNACAQTTDVLLSAICDQILNQ